MDLTITLLTALMLLLVGLSAASWRLQRRQLSRMAAILAATEGSRRELAQQLLALHRELDAPASRISDDAAERRRALEQLLNNMPATPGTDVSWAETQPASVSPEGFASTLPSTFFEPSGH